ncbi:unnamed protein product [Brugia timori]|uniref:SMP-LTD domain-containing protein n=1 Tax=Brugia timori TaxID=42155 RepID=A0A0R3QRM9_9BILA|nr:unnamed protein product [Brugia timori]
MSSSLMSSSLKPQRSPPESQTRYVDSDGNSVDLTGAMWMTKITLPYINIQDIYRKIQDEIIRVLSVVLDILPRGTKTLLRVNCTGNALQ